jgi:transposase
MNKQELRDKFFKEWTTETPRENEHKKVNLAPHDMFEWFWNNFSDINEAPKIKHTCYLCGQYNCICTQTFI